MEKFFEFDVALGQRHATVVALDKLQASKLGANALGVVWKQEARNMVIIRGREVRGKELKKLAPSSREKDKGAAAPNNPSTADAVPIPLHKGGKETSEPVRNSRKAAVPTFKSGPLAGQPMKGGR